MPETTYLTTDTELTGVADAIRTKGSTSASLVWPSGYISAINDIPTGGGGPSGPYIEFKQVAVGVDYVNKVDFGSLSYIPSYFLYSKTFTDDVEFSGKENIKTINNGAFASCNRLPSVINFPEVTLIWSTAFMNAKTVNPDGFSISMNLEANGSRIVQAGSTFYSCDINSFSLSNAYTLSYDWLRNCSKLTSVSFPNVTSVIGMVFGNCTKLSNVYMPELVSISASGFIGCSSLSNVSFPKLAYIGPGAFSACYALESAVFPSATYLGSGAFTNCHSLSYAYLPNVTSLNSYGYFSGCENLTSISMPGLSIINGGGNAFGSLSNISYIEFPSLATIVNHNGFVSSCGNLKSVYLPELTEISYSGTAMTSNYVIFNNCPNLESLDLPKLTYYHRASSIKLIANCPKLNDFYFPMLSSLSGSMFVADYSLYRISFPNLNSINGRPFSSCQKFISMFMLGSSTAYLGYYFTSIFYNSPMTNISVNWARRYGSIYVPESKLSAYKTATNWTTYSSRFFPYEKYFGSIGHFGELISPWELVSSFTVDNLQLSTNNYYYSTIPINVSNYSTLTVVLDGTTYVCATNGHMGPAITVVSNNFGAPGWGMSSYLWQYYPFHMIDDVIYFSTSSSHTLSLYTIPQNNQVTVNLTNPLYSSEFVYLDINETYVSDPEAQDPDLTFLSRIATADGSATVQVSPSAFGLRLFPMTNWGYGISPLNDIACTGGVSFVSRNSMDDLVFSITGDGTITLNNMDYED